MARRKIFYAPTIDHNRYYVDNGQMLGYAPGYKERLNDYIQRNLETARRALKAGVRFAMGSDAVFTMFGQNTHELGWFVRAGMTPEQALATATTNGAALLGMGKSLGAVARLLGRHRCSRRRSPGGYQRRDRPRSIGDESPAK